MDNYWEEAGQTVTIQQAYQTTQQHINQQQDEEFDFTGNQSKNDDTRQDGQIYSTESLQFATQMQPLEQDQVSRQIREEEQRIQQQLQQKANQEYERKIKRKEEGRKWIENFFNQKQQQNLQRKQDNLRKQQELLQIIKNPESFQGWAKVVSSIDLKQSEYKGSKEINRMREAIIHKKEDQSQQAKF